MKRVLIIEDDKSISDLERDYLEINKYEVEVAFDGDTGSKLALEENFDLILLDLMLPFKDGFEVCREIRAKKETPILMVTAKKEDIDKIRGLGLGADDYIVKPFSPSELVARVGAHIARYERLTAAGNAKHPDHVIAIGDLKIYPEQMRVTVKGKEVKLANKEFELLRFLAENPNIVFSKDTLFDRIWGMDSLGDASTVTVHINRIREKIEEDSSTPRYIETVWGAGYRFRV